MMGAVDTARAKVAELEGQLAHSLARGAALVSTAGSAKQRALSDATNTLQHTTQQLQLHFASRPIAEVAPWDEAIWTRDAPRANEQEPNGWIRLGGHIERRNGTPLHIPDMVQLMGRTGPVVITSRGDDQAEAARRLLQSLLLRLALLHPRQARFHLFDPGGAGSAFPMARFVPGLQRSTGDTRRDLDAVNEQIARINSSYFGGRVSSFEQLDDKEKQDEGYRFVLAADFPHRYDIRAVEALQDVARNGPRTGTYAIVHVNLDEVGDDRRSPHVFKDATVIDIASRTATLADSVATRVEFDSRPDEDLEEVLLERLKADVGTDQAENVVTWDEIVGLPEEQWWKGSADVVVTTPFARAGSGKEQLSISFGVHEGNPVVHGILGAMTGVGKSSLLHTLITGLSTRYSPDELRFYLIDGKDGVELAPYRHLPHTDIVSLETPPVLARSVIEDLIEEMRYRNTVFQQHGVTNLTEYRARGADLPAFPRIICLVDEFGALFEGDRDGRASDMLQQLCQKGRNAGLHLLLAAQSYEVPGMLHRAAIFANIHLRLAMKMTPAAVSALTEFGPEGRQAITSTCTSVGRVVMNQSSGDEGANQPGRVAFLDDARRTALLTALERRAQDSGFEHRPIVFNGSEPPSLVGSPLTQALLGLNDWPDEQHTDGIVRDSPRDDGLGLGDWESAERPLLALFGQQFRVRDWSSAVLRRRNTENLAIVGSDGSSRAGLLAGIATNMAILHPPERVRFVILDRSITNTEWSTTLSEDLVKVLESSGHAIAASNDAAGCIDLIAELDREVLRRRSLSEEDLLEQPSIVILAHELDRLDELLRLADDFGSTDSELGKVFSGVLEDGPKTGLHTLAAFSAVGAMQAIVSAQALARLFRHRIAMQMSEDDSFTLLRSSDASKLQSDGPVPVRALYVDSQIQHSNRFKPFSALSTGSTPLRTELDVVAKALAGRRGART